jgi:hypothetical protein
MIGYGEERGLYALAAERLLAELRATPGKAFVLLYWARIFMYLYVCI